MNLTFGVKKHDSEKSKKYPGDYKAGCSLGIGDWRIPRLLGRIPLAKFWWPGAQLYISFIQTRNRYVVENYIWRKRYLFFREDIHRTYWTNNSSFLLCASLKVVILLKQACHGHCIKMCNFNVIPTWLYMPK